MGEIKYRLETGRHQGNKRNTAGHQSESLPQRDLEQARSLNPQTYWFLQTVTLLYKSFRRDTVLTNPVTAVHDLKPQSCISGKPWSEPVWSEQHSSHVLVLGRGHTKKKKGFCDRK